MKAPALFAAVLLATAIRVPAAPDAPSAPPPAASFALDVPWTIPQPPDAVTRARIDPVWKDMWTRFLTPAPPAVPDGLLADLAETFTHDAFLVPSDYAALLARLPPPSDLDLPWCAAGCLLARHATNDAALARYAAPAASAAPPFPDGDWRTPFAAFLALTRQSRSLPASAAARKTALDRQAADLVPAVLASAPSSGVPGRFFAKLLDAPETRRPLPDAPDGLLAAALDAASFPSDNPVALLLRAYAALDAAWNVRGTSWASDVSPAASASYRSRLARAATLASDAARLAPDWPEPFAVLLQTVGAARIPAGLSLRQCFQEALARQLDWTPAYDAFFHFVVPRWSGSAAAPLYALRAVLSLDRFDTRAPFEAVRRFDAVAADQAAMPAAYAKAGLAFPVALHSNLWPRLRRVFEGTLASPAAPVPAPVVLDSFLSHAARARQPADALDAIDRASFAPSFDTRFYHNEDEVACGPGGLPALRALAALQRLAPAALPDAERAFYLRDPAALDAARTALLDAETSLPSPFPEPARTRFFSRLDRDLLILRDWEPEPDWQDLFPSSPVSGLSGRWTDLANGARRGWSYDSRGGLFFVQWSGNANEAAADFVLHTAPASASDANAALVIRASTVHYAALVVNAVSGNADLVVSAPGASSSTVLATAPLDPAPRYAFHRTLPPKGAKGHPSTAPAPGAATAPHIVRLRIRCLGGLASAWVDGRPVFTNVPVPPMPPGQPSSFAAGVFTAQAGYLVDVERLRYRYLLPSPSVPHPPAPAL